MRQNLAVLAALVGAVAVLGCANAAETGRNPYHVCRVGGQLYGSEAFQDCVDRTVVLQCTGAGYAAGSKAYGQCQQSLRDTVFVTHMLALRGYKIGFDLYRFN